MIDTQGLAKMLMGTWDQTKQPLKERGTILPIGLEAQQETDLDKMISGYRDGSNLDANWLPGFDGMLGDYEPVRDGKAEIHDSKRQEYFRAKNRPYVQPELRNASPRVWPSEAWWGQHGISDPGWLDRLGSLQAAAYSYVNGLGFGLPDAILANAAPDAKDYIDGIRHSQSGSGLQSAAELAGFLTSPGQKVLRKAGDALLDRGRSKWTAAAADAGTMAAATTVPSVLEGNGMPSSMSDVALTAFGTRLAMPQLSPMMRERAAAGALGGGFAAMPGVAIEGNWSDLALVPIGALSGAAVKGRQDQHYDGVDEKFVDALFNGMGLMGLADLVKAGSYIADGVTSDSEIPEGQGIPGAQSGQSFLPSNQDVDPALMEVLRQYGLMPSN